jgi:hypothetical protein
VVSRVTELGPSPGAIQPSNLLRLSDDKIRYVIQVKGDGSYWVSETDATDELEVLISYKFDETISTGGDRFVVISTPLDAPLNWLSLCCPERLWFPGLSGESYNSFDATPDWISEVVLRTSVLSLPVGRYVFFHGYDRNPNGVLDFESLQYDFAVVHVKNPITVSLTGSPLSGTAPLEVTFQVVVDDPKETMDTCTLVVGDERSGCALYNQTTLTSEGSYQAWAEVKDIYGREVKSNVLNITVDPANRPPTVYNLTVLPPEVSSYDEDFTINYYYDDPDGLDDVVKHHIGIGASSLTYDAGGSGRFQRTYHFVDPSTPGIHYIDAYVVDSAGNRSNTLSDSVYFRGAQACNTFVEQGGDTPESHWIEMGQNSGIFWISYETFDQEDEIVVWYENNIVWESGCVGTNGTRSSTVSFGPGSSTKVEVEVYPNCLGGSGTKWNFTVSCPTSSPY